MRLARVFFRLDDKVHFMGIKLTGILDLFSEVGGIGSFIFATFHLFAYYFTYDFFIARLIMLLFNVKKDKHEGQSKTKHKEKKTSRLCEKDCLNKLERRIAAGEVLGDSDIENVIHQSKQI